MEVTAVVATFGDPRWIRLGETFARPSIERQGFDETIVYHGGDSVADARNIAASGVTTEWICFVDADDMLEDGYLDAMRATGQERGLLTPNVRDVVDGVAGEARSLTYRNIDYVNPCVIGTLLRREVFDDVGGFWNERAWEDWSLFRRAWLLGENVIPVPDAVYRVFVNPTGRNATVDRPEILHRNIRRSHTAWKRRRPR